MSHLGKIALEHDACVVIGMADYAQVNRYLALITET